MNLKVLLLDYADIKKEIKELEEKIRKLENTYKVADSVEASSDVFPYIKRNLRIEATDKKQQRSLNCYRTILNERYDRLLEQQTKVEEFIDKLPTARLRRIFTYRYIESFSWIKVAMMIGNGATEQSVKLEHFRYLEKI